MKQTVKTDKQNYLLKSKFSSYMKCSHYIKNPLIVLQEEITIIMYP